MSIFLQDCARKWTFLVQIYQNLLVKICSYSIFLLCSVVLLKQSTGFSVARAAGVNYHMLTALVECLIVQSKHMEIFM